MHVYQYLRCKMSCKDLFRPQGLFAPLSEPADVGGRGRPACAAALWACQRPAKGPPCSIRVLALLIAGSVFLFVMGRRWPISTSLESWRIFGPRSLQKALVCHHFGRISRPPSLHDVTKTASQAIYDSLRSRRGTKGLADVASSRWELRKDLKARPFSHKCYQFSFSSQPMRSKKLCKRLQAPKRVKSSQRSKKADREN